MATKTSFKDMVKPKDWDIMGSITLSTLDCTRTTLNLSLKQLTSLPEELFELKEIEALDLTNQYNINLSNKLTKLTNLKLLDLSGCNFDTVPAVVMKLTQLQILILSSNWNITLPDEMSSLVNLTALDLESCNLKSVPAAVMKLPQLQTLVLSDNKNITLPDEMSGLVNLTTLDLENCELATLPPVVLELPNLQKLYLSKNVTISLPDEFCKLKNIKVLDLSYCKLGIVPPVVLNLPQLEQLDLSGNKGIHLSGLTNIRVLILVDAFSPLVWELTQLERLYLSFNPLRTLPAEVGQLTNVKHLDLSHCRLHTLPPEVGRLTQLEWLDMSYNPLQTLPAEIGQLTNVKHLSLLNCSMHTLPPEVGRLTQLEWLSLSRNPLRTLPAEVGQLTNVKHLNLYHCELRTLPPEVGRLTQIELLGLSGNRLQTLPAEVGQLTNVKHLNLSDCELRTLPPEVGRLIQLERLDLSRNRLQTLPAEVGQLTNISHLDVENNPLLKPPLEVCSQGIDAIRQYFDELERSEEKVSVRLKAVVLGEKMAGKTSLVQTLRRGEPSLTEEEDRTHCVEITQWAPDDNITFEVYDFGGHDMYHLTHQFFLTEHALSLLTVNLETYNCTQQSYNEAVGFWLDTLNARVPGAVVTIVGSKSDRLGSEKKEEKTRDIQDRFARQHDIWQCTIQQQITKLENDKTTEGGTDQEEVEQQLERTRQLMTRPLRLTGVCCVSSAEPTSGLDTLRTHIVESANNTELFPTLRVILPHTWVDFEQLLRDLRNKSTDEYQLAESTSNDEQQIGRVQSNKSKWLTREECLQQGQLADLTANRLEPVLSYLQQVGTILRYTDIPELKDLVFHDPSSLIDLIKELFHHDLIKVFNNKNPRLKDFSNTKLKKIRKKLSRRGFLPRDVFIALLGPHATPVGNVDVITNLMEHFGLCYTERFDEQDGEGSTPAGYYIPWYIRKERTETMKKNVPKKEETVFAVTCEMTHFCPRGLFERLSVVVNKLIKSRQDWKDVIVAVRDSLPVVVYRETKEEHVNIVVKLTVPAQAVQASQVIWDVIGPLQEKLSTLLKEWPGLLYCLVYSRFSHQEEQQASTGSAIIATFAVGPEGCTVQHDGVTLEFPEGCVNETRVISVEVEAVPVNDGVRTNFTAMSAVLTVEQDFPQRFLRPVSVRLPWVWTQPGEKHGTTERTTRIVVLHYKREEDWTEFATDTEEGTSEVSFETDQFQSFVVTRVKSVCHGIIVELWDAIWNGYCEDKVYLIVMPNKVFLPDRFVNLLCVHKLDDASDFFSIGYVSPRHQIKQRISMTNREMIRAYCLPTDYDIQIDPRDVPHDGLVFEFPPADRNRYSVAFREKEGVSEKDIYEGRISFERLDLRGNVRDVRGGTIAQLPILLHSHRESHDVVSQHEDTGLRLRTPQQPQQTRPETAAPIPLRQQRHTLATTALPIIVAIAMVTMAIIVHQFVGLTGRGDDAQRNVTSKPRTDSWLRLQMDLRLSPTFVVGLLVAIFGIWFSVFRKGSAKPKVLLINDEYGTSKGGISTINRQLGQILANANAVVYCTALRVPKQDQEAADRDGVKLIGPVQLDEESAPTLDWLTKYHSVHYPNLPQDVTCIIGHADITDTAARNIWEQRYPQADLMTFNHVLPEDTDYLKGGRKAMKARKKEKDILHNSNNAKAAFSVGKRNYEHFKTKYRGEKKPQSHHIFLPKLSDIFHSIDVNPGEENSEKVVLTIGRVRRVEKLKGHDLIAQSMRKVVRIIKNVRWAVRGISEDDWEASLTILEDNLNSPDLNPTLLPYGTQEDIRDDMMTAHLVLMPSRSEPFGLVGLEAIAAGIPVLISDKTGLAGMILDLIEQGKLSAEHRHVIVETSVNDTDPTEDVKRWADKIVDILNHSVSEFAKAARLKRELVESRYWEESHRTFLQACSCSSVEVKGQQPTR